MYITLATARQIAYLQDLADKAEHLKQAHPSLIPQGLMHRTFPLGMTSEKAGLLIQMYRKIVDTAHYTLYPHLRPVKEDCGDIPA